MEPTLTFSNFWTHPRFWRHFWGWFVFMAFVIIMVIASAIGNPDEEFLSELDRLIVFIVGLFMLIYASFYAYNKLQPAKKYFLLTITLISIIIIMAFLNDQFGIKGMVIGNLIGFWANLVMYPFVLMVAFGFKLAYHGGRQLFVIERLKTKQVESELKLLKSQVNPHFLFNTLK